MKQKNPLGNMSPWAWSINLVRGCNLRCGHCSTRTFEKNKFEHMTEETWIAMWQTIKRITPHCRTEIAGPGEPTLHPYLTGFLALARKISPDSQIQITTNGTMLIEHKWTYEQLFNAGANIIYTDMYAPKDQHIELAQQSGQIFYEYHNKPKEAPAAWTYHGPKLKMIILMENPKNWPDKRKSMKRLGTWLNNLDWEAAAPFDLTPVITPPERGCTQPFRYVVVNVDGDYEFCCMDHMKETAGLLGSVKDGVDGFYRYWYSELMQNHRILLRNKDRAGSPYCCRCDMVFSRSDWSMWEENQLKNWWDGKGWLPMMTKEEAENV